MRHMTADLRAAAEILFDAQQAPWCAAPPKKVQVRKKGSNALLRSRTWRVLRRMRQRRRRAQVVASASASPSVRLRLCNIYGFGFATVSVLAYYKKLHHLAGGAY